MFISRKRYEADLERAYEKGRSEAFREVNETQWQEAREKELCELRKKVDELRWQVETKAASKTIPEIPKGCACPPDRLDI